MKALRFFETSGAD